jgi:hypothetical protein
MNNLPPSLAGMNYKRGRRDFLNYTTHYRLQKDLTVEKYDVNVVNMNSDIIDSALHRLDLKNESQDELLATKESLNSEITRATSKEDDIIEVLESEIERANSAENSNSANISEETTRALLAEETIRTSLQEHISDKTNPHNVTKEQLAIGNVDNTSDIDKPVSTAQQNALDTALSTHNTSDSSHNDMRLLISGLTTRLNALADSDDTTLDQLSEIVAYIKNNKSIIDGITTSKVNVSDIIDNLTTSSTDKALSAKQGQILKEMINSLTKEDIGLGNVENKNSAAIRSELTKEDVTNALGYTPPTTNTVYAHPTTSGNKHIPSGGSSGQILRWSADGTAVWGADNNTTYSNFVKSGSGAKSGLVPAPSITAGTTKYLREDGTWATPASGGITYSDSQPASLTSGMTWIGK